MRLRHWKLVQKLKWRFESINFHCFAQEMLKNGCERANYYSIIQFACNFKWSKTVLSSQTIIRCINNKFYIDPSFAMQTNEKRPLLLSLSLSLYRLGNKIEIEWYLPVDGKFNPAVNEELWPCNNEPEPLCENEPPGWLYEYPCGLAAARAMHDKTMNTFIFLIKCFNCVSE